MADDQPLACCPFCNSIKVQQAMNLSNGGYIYVVCEQCGATGPFRDGDRILEPEEAIEAWNTRVEPIGNPDELPGWLVKIINDAIDFAYDNLSRSAPLKNRTSDRNWRVYIQTMKWVLSLRRDE